MMSDSELWSKVTSEQKKLAYTIYEKWLITAKSTERINYQAATDAINASYLAIGFKKVKDLKNLSFPAPFATFAPMQPNRKVKCKIV